MAKKTQWKRVVESRDKLQRQLVLDLRDLDNTPREESRKRSDLMKMINATVSTINKLTAEAEIMKATSDNEERKRLVRLGKLLPEPRDGVVDLRGAMEKLKAIKK